MKPFLIFVSLAAIIGFSGGCSFLQELRNPKKKPADTVQKPVSNKPEVLPDGTTSGFNDYEKQYINDIDQDFKRRQQQNSRKVFGGLTL